MQLRKRIAKSLSKIVQTDANRDASIWLMPYENLLEMNEQRRWRMKKKERKKERIKSKRKAYERTPQSLCPLLKYIARVHRLQRNSFKERMHFPTRLSPQKEAGETTQECMVAESIHSTRVS